MFYKPQFKVGRCYLRHDGVPVRIIAESNKSGPHYRCVQGDDGEGRWEESVLSPGTSYWLPASNFGWRYDRASDPGRCTASHKGEPRNLVVGSNWTLRAMLYRIKCELKDAINKWQFLLYCGYH
jgi:hypothetical protein